MIREIAKRIIINLDHAYSGTWDVKFLAISKLSLIPAFFVFSFEQLTDWYVVNGWFMSGVLIVLGIDHVLGTFVHLFIIRDWSWRRNIFGMLTKLFMVIFGYVILELMYIIITPVEFVSAYFRVVIQLMVFLYPGLSALGSMSIITSGKFPPVGWIEKLNSFNQSGDLNKLKTKNDEYTNYQE